MTTRKVYHDTRGNIDYSFEPSDDVQPQPAFRAFLNRTIYETKQKLNLQDWFVTVIFSNKKITHPNSKEALTFEIDVDTTYFCAVITVATIAEKFFNEGKLNMLANEIAHEMAHIVTTPAHDFGTEHLPKEKQKEWDTLMEQQTQKVANLIVSPNP